VEVIQGVEANLATWSPSIAVWRPTSARCFFIRRIKDRFRLKESLPARPAKTPVRVTITLVLMVLGLPPAAASAQCDRDKEIKAPRNDEGYQRLSKTFCEGIFGTPRSGALIFIGLTEPSILENWDPITLSWRAQTGRMHLRSQAVAARPGQSAYQMDAHVADSTSFVWFPTIPARQGILVANLGLLAWIEDPASESEEAPRDDEILYVPLRAFQGEDVEPGQGYLFRFVANSKPTEVAVTLARVDSVGQRPSGPLLRDRQVEARQFAGLEVFDLWVDQSELPSEGIYLFKIDSMSVDGPSTITFWFSHGG
jgi:hypothetical protein